MFDDLQQIQADRQAITVLGDHIDTTRPIVLIIISATIIFDAVVYPRRKQNRTGSDYTLNPCRVQFVIPQAGTIVLWGNAAATAKFELHNDQDAGVYAANCQHLDNAYGKPPPMPPQQPSSSKSHNTGDQAQEPDDIGAKRYRNPNQYDGCVNMSTSRRAAAGDKAPDVPMEETPPWSHAQNEAQQQQQQQQQHPQ